MIHTCLIIVVFLFAFFKVKTHASDEFSLVSLAREQIKMIINAFYDRYS